MNGTLRRILVLLGALSLLALSLPATAGEGGGGDSAPWDDPQFAYDSWFHMLIYGFDAPEPPECSWPEGVTAVEIVSDRVVIVVSDPPIVPPWELLPECSVLNAEGPNGQVNHGSFVSALVHALKEGFAGNTPFGRYVGQIAGSELGKGEDHVKGSDGDGDLTSTESANGPKPKNGNGHGRKNA